MSDSLIRAPIGRILPSFIPVIIERGILGYVTEALTTDEIRIPQHFLRPLLIASAFVGTWAYACERNFDSDTVEELLRQSIPAIDGVSSQEERQALDLISRFHAFQIIRAEHSLDDWLCEALWPAFQTATYRYPSAMSSVIAYALSISATLQKMALEY